MTKNKPGYKHTALGWIPEDWEIKKLEECSIIKGNYGINAASVEYSEDLPAYLRITDIDDDGNYSIEKKVSVDNSNSDEYILENGDLVFARTGATVGKSYLHEPKNGKLVFAGFLIRFRLQENILLPRFLKNFTTSKPYWDWVKVQSMRSGQPGINATEYCSLSLPIPPLPEQKAITKVLSTWDKAIEKTQELIKQKELRKKYLMQQLLTGKMRLKKFANNEIAIKSLKELISPVLRPKPKPAFKFLSLGIRSHAKGTFLKFDFDPKTIEMETLYEVKENDLIVNITFAWEGAIAIACSADDGALVSHRFPTYTINNRALDIYYLKFVIAQPRFKYLLGLISPGGAGRNRVLSKEAFLDLSIKIPDIDEQKAIGAILSKASEELELLNHKLKSLVSQKKGLMQLLLTGKKRIINILEN